LVSLLSLLSLLSFGAREEKENIFSSTKFSLIIFLTLGFLILFGKFKKLKPFSFSGLSIIFLPKADLEGIVYIPILLCSLLIVILLGIVSLFPFSL